MKRNKLNRIYWILLHTTFGELWQPIKPRYGNYFLRGMNNRFRKIIKIKNMKIILESTTKIVEVNNVPARVWEGETESGIKIHCFITRIAVDKDETRLQEFEQELKEQKAPSPELEVYPLRMIL